VGEEKEARGKLSWETGKDKLSRSQRTDVIKIGGGVQGEN